jgi:hypothetical protein
MFLQLYTTFSILQLSQASHAALSLDMLSPCALPSIYKTKAFVLS